MSHPDPPTAEWLLEARRIKHEMSNILMGLLGHAELLEDYPDLRDASRQKVRLIREQLHRLQGQIDALSALCTQDTRP